MRLPPFLTALSPVGETLEALEAGETLLTEEAAAHCRQVTVEGAEEGLALWEGDYGLSGGGSRAQRRDAVRAALSGGRTLTPAALAQLAVTVGGADRGGVEEDFPRWRVVLEAIRRDGLPSGSRALLRAVERLKPAHLRVEVRPVGEFSAPAPRNTALHGWLWLELTGR